MLEGRHNFILLGSNHNPEGFGRPESGTFEQFLQAESKNPKINADVWSGNLTLVQEAYERSAAGAVLLETRLDADDGLHRDFVKTVQTEANNYLVKSSTEENGLWRLWCVHSNIEWHPINPYPDVPEIKASIAQNGNQTNPEGYLVMYADGNICVTPGLTFGYGPGAGRSSIPGDRLRHDQIVRKIVACKQEPKKSNGDNGEHGPEVSCVSRLTKLLPGAVRTRTTTSAGMNNVFTGNEAVDQNLGFKTKKDNKKLIRQFFEQKKLWRGLQGLFSVSPESAADARMLILDRMQEIAEDNLRGQCTPGHSCKEGAQSLLQRVASQ